MRDAVNTLPVFAYAFRTGEIGFSSVMPKGALPIGRIDDKLTEESIRGCARHAWDGGLLVPGVPEASDDLAALEAFKVWSARLTRKQRDGKVGIAAVGS
jgi:hypothetical protein